ncbi:hypothetical protein [Nostoc sp.]|uniref:hypothetical protein n=1 Tax=Nostoc sp. TaxID=1180 RepID=UPI002FF80408
MIKNTYIYEGCDRQRFLLATPWLTYTTMRAIACQYISVQESLQVIKIINADINQLNQE